MDQKTAFKKLNNFNKYSVMCKWLELKGIDQDTRIYTICEVV